VHSSARGQVRPALHLPGPDPLWTIVDQYLVAQLVPQDDALTEALRTSTVAGLPAIHVAPNQGKMLNLLARIRGATRILEIGTLGGYSTIWLARALPPGGRLITLEIDPRHATVARANLANAGLSDVAEVRLGRAVESLAAMASVSTPPFDFVFIDADKPSNPEYFTWALAMTRPGSVIIVDNVVRRGLVADASSTDANVIGVRRLNDLIAAEKRVSATSVQTVGSKGHDGFTLIVVGES
jgi:predicted O-methyltransferase YrrM